MKSDGLELAPPAALGLHADRWQQVLVQAQEFVQQGVLPAVSLQIQRRGLTTGTHCFGSRSLKSQQPVTPETLYLIASLTKPMVAMAILLLVQRGKISLNHRIVELLPEFRDGSKRPITLRHVLAHASGLPDMLPNNEQLRREQAPLSAFVRGACESDLLFAPGKGTQYQSMGYALLGQIIENVTGDPYQEFVRKELFQPLEMHASSLGLPLERQSTFQIAEVRVPEQQLGGDDWNWNSPYWRSLGAPWGGAFCTVSDVSRFCRATISGGVAPSGERLFSLATLDEACGNRLLDFPGINEQDARSRGWGLGWRWNWKDHRATLCDLLPADVIGHWGATGCLCWIDRPREVAAVILSTQPTDRDIPPTLLLSNLMAAAFEV